jgi:homoserine O-acetyltransferase
MPGYELSAKFWSRSEPFRLEHGGELPGLRLAYETWGAHAKGDNAVVVLHALSGSSHAFQSSQNPLPGWWEGLLAAGSPFRLERHHLICSNLLGGCYGSTGPSSHCPATGRPYGAAFPPVTTGDMIEAHRLLLQGLGVRGRVTLIGGSLGGMLALEWAVRYPDEVRAAISIVAPGRSAPQAIALRAVQREAVLNDPDWNGGDCYNGAFPTRGLSLARKIGMITYRSADEFDARFHRDERDPRPHFLEGSFEVQSYLDHQGKKFSERFDPNTYLYFSRAMDLYDLSKGHASLEEAVAGVQAKVLLLAVDSDILVRSKEVEDLHHALCAAGKRSRYALIHSIHGHDSFLIEMDQIRAQLTSFFDDA